MESFESKTYKKFVKDIEAMKVEVAYDKLKDALSIGTNKLSYEALIEAIDSASEYYLTAVDLYLYAKNLVEKFKIYHEIQMAKLLEEAAKILEEKKRKKEISSQVTVELKRSWVINNKQETFEFLERRKRELGISVDRMEGLKEAWRGRLSSLQSQARLYDNSKRKIGGLSNGEEDEKG